MKSPRGFRRLLAAPPRGWDLTECDTIRTNPSNLGAVRGASLLSSQVTCGGKKKTAFADFKGAFNGTDHRLMFQFMRELGIPECYVATCEQLYLASNTYYMTPHGNTADIPIRRGTLQGHTLSPFLFTLFLEPLMRWLKVGSRGYQPACSTTSTGDGEMHVTYDEHVYADDISITTGTLHDMKIQLHKLHLFSKYTGLQLEISKCEVTGAPRQPRQQVQPADTKTADRNHRTRRRHSPQISPTEQLLQNAGSTRERHARLPRPLRTYHERCAQNCRGPPAQQTIPRAQTTGS